MPSRVCTLLGVVVLIGLSHQQPPLFDGVLRSVPDGRLEAYLRPPYPSNHASNLEILPSRDVLLAWFSGSKEGKSDVAIVMSRLTNANGTFSSATVMSRRHGYSNQNPVLFHDNVTDHVTLFHSQQPADKGETNAEIWALQSNDSSASSWTNPKPLFTKPGSFDRNRLILSLKGSWLLPIYYAVKGDSHQTSSIMEGQHHQLNASDWKEHTIHDSNNLVQPSIVRLKPGEPRLVAFFRDRRAEHIYRSESGDDGVTWSKPSKTTLPNNNSGIQATMLQSGSVAIVYNPTTKDRCPLVISLSQDAGLSWTYTRPLQTSNDTKDEFSYPSIAQDAAGQIHVSHTYKRQTIKYHIIPNEDWIKKHI